MAKIAQKDQKVKSDFSFTDPDTAHHSQRDKVRQQKQPSVASVSVTEGANSETKAQRRSERDGLSKGEL